jgi:mannose-6-phosphate isomerase-like protein (cupin superfamily)
MDLVIEVKSLDRAFASFSETWSPRVAADVDDMQLKLAKLEGEFVWHLHDDEDELFLVVAGRLRIELRDRAPLVLGPGDFTVIPKGVEHRPVAETPCQVILIEKSTALNTGDIESSELTRRHLERI